MTAPIHQDIIIVGTGIAGAATAREVRKLDSDVSITFITADDGTMYSKPMLSNAMALKKTLNSLAQKSALDFAAEIKGTVHTHTRVVAIDRAAKSVTVEGSDGRAVIGYGRLVLATGATPRTYAVEGSAAAPLFVVNDLGDYTQWRESLKPDARVLIIGAGLIGSEFANDLGIAGHRVSVVDPAPWPLGRLLPEAMGHAMAGALSGVGIDLHMGRSVSRMVPGADDGWVAHFDNGKMMHFDIALLAIGLIPNIALAIDAGLDVGQGVKVDLFMRTSDTNIFAIGDVAETQAGVLPYILPVMTEARALAKTLTGQDTPVHLPALPVSVKTPAMPCVVCPPKPGALGEWVVEGQGTDFKAIFVGEDGAPLGFALSGAQVSARQTMAKNMPDLMAVARAA